MAATIVRSVHLIGDQRTARASPEFVALYQPSSNNFSRSYSRTTSSGMMCERMTRFSPTSLSVTWTASTPNRGSRTNTKAPGRSCPSCSSKFTEAGDLAWSAGRGPAELDGPHLDYLEHDQRLATASADTFGDGLRLRSSSIVHFSQRMM